MNAVYTKIPHECFHKNHTFVAPSSQLYIAWTLARLIASLITTSHQTTRMAVHDPVLYRLGRVHVTLSQLQYFTFTVIGVALLWPWNCFLSASGYYGERLASLPHLVKTYSLTMMTVLTLVSTTFNYVLSQKQKGVSYHWRITTGMLIIIVVFVVMAFLCVLAVFTAMPDTLFYCMVMAMVFLSAAATCLTQNGTMATVNVMGQLYTNAVMVGQAIAGTLPSLALILLVLLVGENTYLATDFEPDYGVFVYYITASLVAAAALGLLALSNHHKAEAVYASLDETLLGRGPEVPPQKTHRPFGVLWRKLKPIVLAIFFTFAITLLFPVFASIVESVHQDSGAAFFRKSIYIPFVYLVWNAGDLAGRILCGNPRFRFLIKDPQVLLVYSLSRVLFVPLFLTCNIHPQASGPVISSDLWYLALQFLFGLSNGQLATSCFMIVGDHCDTADEKEAAGGFTLIFLSVGLALGSLASYLLVLVVG